MNGIVLAEWGMIGKQKLGTEQLESRELMTASVSIGTLQPAFEGGQAGVLEVHRSDADGPLEVRVKFDWINSSTSSSDLILPSSVVRFAPGQTNAMLAIDAIFDQHHEEREYLEIAVSPSDNYEIDDDFANAVLEIHNRVHFSQSVTLDVPNASSVREWELQITNRAATNAEFFLQVNGSLWINTAHLVEHIRSMPEEFPGETEYQRAYRFVVGQTRHDYYIAADDTNWHRDPSTYLNSIGFGFCGDVATALTLIWKDMGYDARVWRLNGHTVSEVFADGRWNMFDADLRVYFHNENGQVAGVEELAANPKLIRRPIDPVQRPDGVTFNVYGNRMADIYGTTENNHICEDCSPVRPQQRDLKFKLPPGGSLMIGDHYSTRDLPLAKGTQSSFDFGQAKLTIPAGWSGQIDLPLALFDVLGSSSDFVAIGNRSFGVGTDKLFNHINSGNANRIYPIQIHENDAPIELIYLVNPKIAELQARNEIRLEQLGEASVLETRLVRRSNVPQKFSWSLRESEGVVARDAQGNANGRVRKLDLQTTEGLEYVQRRNQYVDISTVPGEEIFRGDSSFVIEATVRLNAEDNFRRPIVDASRFSLLVDSQNRLLVSVRGSNGKYSNVKAPADKALSTDEWHRVAVIVTAKGSEQLVQLTANGETIAEGLVPGISSTHELRGPYIGLRHRPGSSEFFSGMIKDVAIELKSEDAAASPAGITQTDFKLPELQWNFGLQFPNSPDVGVAPILANGPTESNLGVELNGSDQYADVSSAETLALMQSSEAFTVQAWYSVSGDAPSRNPIFDGVRFTLMHEHGRLVAYYTTALGNQLKVKSPVDVDADTWHRATVVYDPLGEHASLTLFLNGEQVAQRSGHAMSKTSPLRSVNIGRRDRGASSEYFKGTIAQVSVWERVLERDAIRTNAATETVSTDIRRRG